MGLSFGGYLAPRAASADRRLAACIADPGEYSLREELESRMPAFVARQLDGGSRLERITCPTLVCSAEKDEIGVTARKLFDALTCEKEFVTFTAAEGAGTHCESGARAVFNRRALDWLDRVLG